MTAVEKIVATKKLLKEKIETFKSDKVKVPPLIAKLTEQTKSLQMEVSYIVIELWYHRSHVLIMAIFRLQIEKDISKRYKNRLVNIMGGINLF